MAEYADSLTSLRLYQELGQSAGRDGLTASDVAQLQGMVGSVADFIGPVLQRIPLTFRQYTEHDFRHCRNLIEHMGDFIPPYTLSSLNALEISLVVLAALLHDIGMVVSDSEKLSALNSSDFNNFRDHLHGEHADAIEDARQRKCDALGRLIEDALLAEYFRRLHPERVGAYLQANLAERLMFRDLDIISHLAQLCESHAWGVEDSTDALNPQKTVRNLDDNVRLYKFRVNLQYLACCLRLADILDFDRSRTPLAVFRQIEFTESKSWEEWNKHLQVQGLEISPTRIGFDIPCTHPVFYVAVHQFLDSIDHELRQCRYLTENKPRQTAERYQLLLPQAIDRHRVRMKDPSYVAGAFRFQLEFDEIVRLLMDKSLYPNNSLFLRELLQNALDACRRKEAEVRSLADEQIYHGRIDILYARSKDNSLAIVIKDNGIGMSLRIVEQYFMRVGRSYYRSPEFELERTRLHASGIELEACSQFGIGILSCFLVADRFEVETWQHGHEPLHIIIEGPAKYFVIRRLPTPALGHKSSGTKITVHLRESLDADLFEILDHFAVNVDFDIIVNEDRRVSAKRWEATVKVPKFRDNQRRGAQEESQRQIDLTEILAPLRIPFEKWAFSRHIRGRAWLWLLRAETGEVTPRRGFLRVARNLQVIGAAEFIMKLGRAVQVIANSDSRINQLIKKLQEGKKDNGAIRRAFEVVLGGDSTRTLRYRDRLEPWEIDNLFGDFDDFWTYVGRLDVQWQALSLEERGKVINALVARYFDRQRPPWEVLWQRQWTAVDGIFGALLKGSLAWVNSLSFVELPSQEIYCGLPETLEEVGLFGIRIPEGIVTWKAGSVQSARVRLFPFPGGCQVDFRGVHAPRPAAHRLFIPSDASKNSIVSIARATLRCCASLVAGQRDSSAWRDWFTSIWRGAYSPEIMTHLKRSEASRIEEQCGLAATISGRVVSLSRKDLVTRFGRWVPVVAAGGEGLLREDGINLFCLGDELKEGEADLGVRTP